MSTTARRDFGSLRKLRSGRWQAILHRAGRAAAQRPEDVRDKTTADVWLRRQQTDIASGRGASRSRPAAAVPTFAEYAARVIAHRASNGLRPNTERNYRRLLTGHLMPVFGPTRIDQITVARGQRVVRQLRAPDPPDAGRRLPAAEFGDEGRDR